MPYSSAIWRRRSPMVVWGNLSIVFYPIGCIVWDMFTHNDNTPPAMHKALVSEPVADADATYRIIRAHFVRSGTTFNKWCLENGISRTYAEKSIKSERNGPKAKAIRDLVSQAVGFVL
ncbi:hypothetical protein WCLP8_2120002 [uncultured Gammaproteobacteria bacterium]